jgi:predicted negative regulator of RcsB-dependent stress response
VAELRTEEEQVEALKSWWKENGKSLIMGVVIAVAAVFGWRGWNQYQDDFAANASAMYESILNPVATGLPLDDAAVTSLIQVGKDLRTDYASSAYAPMAAMVLARVAVEAGDLEGALEQLDYVIASDVSPLDMKSLATIRKAKVQLGLGQAEAASASLAQLEGSAFPSLFAEAQGDVAAAQGNASEARASYEVAMATADPQRKQVIKLKYDDLATGDAS